MGNKLFSKEDFNTALQGLRSSYKVYVPVKDGDYHNFKVLEDKVKPNFKFQNTKLSGKFLSQPQAERMFEYSLDDNEEGAHILKESEKDYSPQAVVGIRPCDAYAYELVKKNFDNPEFQDAFWIKRYETTTFIGFACNEPCVSCFCTTTGSGPFSEKGLDAVIYDLGDDFLVKALNDKGEEFLSKMEGGKDEDGSSADKVKELESSSLSKISSEIKTGDLKDKVLNELFDAPFWDDVSFACLNCGTCTYLCPTCWCFDIQDEVNGKEGDRIRNWDSCMFPLFTLHGSGHNPRDKKVQRVRQRFMHKLKYYVDKYEGGVGCVGCGRCVKYCPVNIDIREVCEKMNSF